MKFIRIGTRASKLAIKQTELAIDYIKQYYSDWNFEIVLIKTCGDKIQDRPLYDIGGKALFTKEIDEALISGKIDLAMHSAKDIEAQYRKNLLCFPCVLPRDDPRDVFISKNNTSLLELPFGGIIGSSSVRRQSQILHKRPDIKFEFIRGNINTRLSKLEASNSLDGIILAAAGLKRVSLLTSDMEMLDDMIPAAGQGIIAIQCLTNNCLLKEQLSKIKHDNTWYQFIMERAFVEKIDGSCITPLGVLTKIIDNKIYGDFIVANRNGSFIKKISINDYLENAEIIGIKAAIELEKYLDHDYLENAEIIGIKAAIELEKYLDH